MDPRISRSGGSPGSYSIKKGGDNRERSISTNEMQEVYNEKYVQ